MSISFIHNLNESLIRVYGFIVFGNDKVNLHYFVCFACKLEPRLEPRTHATELCRPYKK